MHCRPATRPLFFPLKALIATAGLAAPLLANATGAGDETAAESADSDTDPTILVIGQQEKDYGQKDQSTAYRLPMSIKETPQSISVITEAQMKDFDLSTINDVLQYTTGVHVEQSETDRIYYNARGFDITNFQYDGIGQPLAYGLQVGQVETATLERVEVVRGATGLLSATGNPSATINMVRKRPGRDAGASFDASYDTQGLYTVNADVNTPLTRDGSVRSRYVVAYEDGDNYLDRYKPNKLTLYGIVSADLTPSTVGTLGYSWHRSDPRGSTWGALPLTYADGSMASYARSTNTGLDWTRYTSIDRDLFGDITQDLGNGWTLKVSSMYRNTDQDDRLFYIYGLQDGASGDGLYSWPGAYMDKVDQVTADANITGSFELGGRKHDLMFGVNYGKTDLKEYEATDDSTIGLELPGDSAFDGSFPEPSFGAFSDQANFTQSRKSLYGMVRFSLMDPMKLMLGSNLTDAHSDGTSYDVAYDYDKTKLLPFAGLTYDITQTVTGYVSYATIYNPQTEIDASYKVLKPIEGSTYEGGIKGAWFQDRFQAGASVFSTHQDNTAESVGYDSSIGAYIYEGQDATSRGVELTLAGEPTQGLQLNGGYAYVHIEDNDGDAARTFIPRHSANVSATYTLPQVPAWTVGASARYQSKTHNETGSTATDGSDIVARVSSYAVLNLMTRYQISEKLSVTANVDNVTNEKHFTSVEYDQAFYNEPCTGRVTVSYHF